MRDLKSLAGSLMAQIHLAARPQADRSETQLIPRDMSDRLEM
jgi:hypothetical protein